MSDFEPQNPDYAALVRASFAGQGLMLAGSDIYKVNRVAAAETFCRRRDTKSSCAVLPLSLIRIPARVPGGIRP